MTGALCDTTDPVIVPFTAGNLTVAFVGLGINVVLGRTVSASVVDLEVDVPVTGLVVENCREGVRLRAPTCKLIGVPPVGINGEG